MDNLSISLSKAENYLENAKRAYEAIDFRAFAKYSTDRRTFKIAGGSGHCIHDEDAVEIIRVDIKAGAIIKDHWHAYSDRFLVIQGKIKLNTPKNSLILTQGNYYNLSPNTYHNVEVLENTLLLLIRIPSSEEHRIE